MPMSFLYFSFSKLTRFSNVLLSKELSPSGTEMTLILGVLVPFNFPFRVPSKTSSQTASPKSIVSSLLLYLAVAETDVSSSPCPRISLFLPDF